jgi:hypothetical protein
MMMMMMMRKLSLFAAAVWAAVPSPGFAWGYEGHETIAAIAHAYLTDDVRAKVDAILAKDTDTLTGPDMIARSTWADAWRAAGHRDTADWHFVDTELDHPDLDSACFNYPRQNDLASAGPAQDCVVDKVEAFETELADPETADAERLLALKYLLHFVGDLHQPLHASDNHDRGGNCVRVILEGSRTVNLHSWWDTVVVQELGTDPQALADQLRQQITPQEKATWEKGDARTWAMESFEVSKAASYTLHSPAGCASDAAPIPLPADYDAKAKAAAALQIERAGVRLALVLNRALSAGR